MLGGMNWAGIEMVARLLGIEDDEGMEVLIVQLSVIRDGQKNGH